MKFGDMTPDQKRAATERARDQLQAELRANAREIGRVLESVTVAARRKDGTTVTPGDAIEDFRGQVWTFQSARAPHSPASTGRVIVTDEFGGVREFYPTVFDLTVTVDA